MAARNSPHSIQRARDLHRAGKSGDAEALCREIIGGTGNTPAAAEAWHLLGVIAMQSGRAGEAIEPFRRAISLSSSTARYHVNLANALRQSNHLAEAVDAVRNAIVIDPHLVAAYNMLGVLLREQQEIEPAIEAFTRATELAPDSADGWANLGLTLTNAGHHADAIKPLQIALAKLPDNAQLLRGWSRALERLGHRERALAAIEKAISLYPDDVTTLKQAAMIHLQRHAPSAAIALLHRSLQIAPDDGYVHMLLGSALKDQGFGEAAMKEFDLAVTLAPEVEWIGGMRLLSAHYVAGIEPQTIAAWHREWGTAHTAGIKKLPPIADAGDTAGRRLRIGYVSPDFRQHALAFFLSPLVDEFDRESLEVFCYSNAKSSGPTDEHSEQIASKVSGWREIDRLNDDQAAQLIREDRIDVLVDLSGHTGFNRLMIFARKPAPIQVTYLGYPDTTGMTAFDYRLTDAHADPPGPADELHVERLIRLDGCAWCYRPILQTPPVTPPPSLMSGTITFGSFNIAAKLSEPALRLWAEILNRVPGSRFLFKADTLLDPPARQRVIDVFASCGIHADRLQFQSRVPSLFEHFNRYAEVDIALDPFPYNGTTTTCDALWMGVPVITLAGTTHVSRVGVSLLNAVGLGDLIATTPQEYVQLAVALSADSERLKSIRANLRERLIQSPLGDVKRFAKVLADVYRSLVFENRR